MAPIHFLCSQIFSAGMNLVQHATAVENTFEDDALDATTLDATTTSSTNGSRHCMHRFCRRRSTLGLYVLLELAAGR